MKPDEVVKLRCPQCGRYLAEGKGYIRSVCRDCGAETTYRSKEDRRQNASGAIRVLSAS